MPRLAYSDPRMARAYDATNQESADKVTWLDAIAANGLAFQSGERDRLLTQTTQSITVKGENHGKETFSVT